MAWASNKLFKMDKSKTIIGSYYAIIKPIKRSVKNVFIST